MMSISLINMAIGVRKGGHTVKLSISISEGSADWIDKKLKDYRYRNISHVFESLIQEKMATEQKN
jgi:Arc/MetJ-type ribon-helix-helix transcriptional regulator